MKESHAHGESQSRGKHAPERAFQIICLASGGGPSESNVTGFLVRSVNTNWSKGSVLAVDAGSHLSSITGLLELHFPLFSETSRSGKLSNANHRNGSTQPDTDEESVSSDSSDSDSPEPYYHVLEDGPFAGLRLPHDSARANALHIVRECVSTYLITHPHLDHLSGFVINTAAFHNTSRPKKLAALPSTVNAIKTHVFNDVIWPNLTDEDGGVGFVTFQRLAQGGNIAVGEGSGKGYIEVCDGLCVKGMKVSHGHCMRPHDTFYSRGSDVGLSEATAFKGSSSSAHMESPKSLRRTPSIPQAPQTATPNAPPAGQHTSPQTGEFGHREAVVDSTAYFIRDDKSGREILFFGDVEPDLVSLNPRTLHVWTEAAPKIAQGQLRAVLIECSYDDSQADNILFGHLAPRHLIKELQVLAEMVKVKRTEEKAKKESKKRKWARSAASDTYTDVSGPPTDDEFEERGVKKAHKHGHGMSSLQKEMLHEKLEMHQDEASPMTQPQHPPFNRATTSEVLTRGPLSGLTIIVIHVKDTLHDGPPVGERILRQLKEHDARLKESDGTGLGCEFVISEVGASYWF